ncbi:MAG: hypothetical protein HN390_16065 [Anaerolineae bacterium]|nr:hypothetical protein [Anaerolineae bacterium]MBT7990695.1 hypothetical protein [Anaerolineae bacterium]
MIEHKEQPAIIKMIENKLLKLGLIKSVARDGIIEIISENPPLEVLGKPLVIEFAGTPNSGKNTQIEILADYLRDYRGFNVTVIDEVYRYCKLESRYDYKLYWMFATTIRNLVEITEDTKSDIVILNRGLFDILAFLHLYHEQQYINRSELITHATSLTRRKLCNIVDIVIVMTTTPDISLQREGIYPRSPIAGLAEELDQWDPKPESTLANKKGLKKINNCYNIALNKYKKKFKDIYHLTDNGDKTINAVAIEIGKHLQNTLPDGKITFQKNSRLRHRKQEKGQQLSFADWLNNHSI